MKTNDFTYVIKFDKCDNCPFKDLVDDDYSPTHTECSRIDEYIEKWTRGGKTDYRNPETGVLDNCPFLKENIIIDK